jgi:uncharacterized protein YndB with AHSA1/START domain
MYKITGWEVVQRVPLQETPQVTWLDGCMPEQMETERVAKADREIRASADRIFEFIADPALQPRWDGNDNLKEAAPGQRVRAIGDVFTMRLKRGGIRENQVVDFVEGRRIAWRPSVPGKSPPGHFWVWELEPLGPSLTLVVHTYDWTELTDRSRIPRARATTAEKLRASLDRLAAIAEKPEQQHE